MSTNTFQITLERQDILAHYQQLVWNVEDLRASRWPSAEEHGQAVNAAIDEQVAFRDLHEITIQELTAWRNRKSLKATSVTQAVDMLSAAIGASK